MGNFEELLLHFLTIYKIPTVFIGSFLFGETIIISASVIAFRLDWPIFSVFAAAFFGTVISDMIWYTLGKKILHFSKMRGTSLYEKYQHRFDALAKLIPFEKPFFVLLYIKFLYGTRILTLLYLSMHRMKMTKFIVFETIGTVIWLGSLMLIAFLSASGVSSAIHAFHQYTIIVTAVAVALIITKALSIWITRETEKK